MTTGEFDEKYDRLVEKAEQSLSSIPHTQPFVELPIPLGHLHPIGVDLSSDGSSTNQTHKIRFKSKNGREWIRVY